MFRTRDLILLIFAFLRFYHKAYRPRMDLSIPCIYTNLRMIIQQPKRKATFGHVSFQTAPIYK